MEGHELPTLLVRAICILTLEGNKITSIRYNFRRGSKIFANHAVNCSIPVSAGVFMERCKHDWKNCLHIIGDV